MSRASARKVDDPRLDAIFGALSHPHRRRIVARLARGPATVGELAEPFAMSLPAVSSTSTCWSAPVSSSASATAAPAAAASTARRSRGRARYSTPWRSFWEETLDELARYVEGGGSEGGKDRDGGAKSNDDRRKDSR